MKKVKITIELNETQPDTSNLSVREKLLLKIDAEKRLALQIEENNITLINVYKKVFQSYLDKIGKEIDPMFAKQCSFYPSDKEMKVSLPSLYYSSNNCVRYYLAVKNLQKEETQFKVERNIYIVPEIKSLSENDLVLIREGNYSRTIATIDDLIKDYENYFYYEQRKK